MQPKFTVGDVVELKSGGPEMTVSKIFNTDIMNGNQLPFDGSVSCTWFDAKHELKGGTFEQDMLEKVEDYED